MVQGQLTGASVTCTVDGLVPLEWTLTQGSYPGHGPAQNNFHRFHKALGGQQVRCKDLPFTSPLAMN